MELPDSVSAEIKEVLESQHPITQQQALQILQNEIAEIKNRIQSGYEIMEQCRQQMRSLQGRLKGYQRLYNDIAPAKQ